MSSSSSSDSGMNANQVAKNTPAVATSPAPKKKKNPLQHLLAGGAAGFVESSVCHPLDTIKTRMQLRRQSATVDAVKERARSSLAEPALRLKHSLAEPINAIRHSLMEPSHKAPGAAAVGMAHEPGLKFTASAATTASPHASKITVQNIKHTGAIQARLGPFGTAKRIVQREGFFALYKGLSAVYTGIIPKMAIRFLSFEQYKELLAPYLSGGDTTNSKTIFLAGLASGLTEAVLVVTPAEVCKIRLQSQYHSLMDPSQQQHKKYKNVVQTAYVITKEEGLGALYKGVVPTMLRQGCNQAVNFTAYQYIKKSVLAYQGKPGGELEHWQSLLIGGFSGGMGPLVNNPLDVVKTRLQKQVVSPGQTPKYTGLIQACVVIAKEEGILALWKGITPRLLRIMPGQAITFMTYEAVSSRLNKWGIL